MIKLSCISLCLLLAACTTTNSQPSDQGVKASSDISTSQVDKKPQLTLEQALALKGDGSDINEQSDEVSQDKYSGLAIYGNWCGPNHPSDMDKADEPIDRLDQACQAHDLCYEEQGYLSCECDRQLTISVSSDLREGHFSGDQHLYAQSIYQYFNSSLCRGDNTHKSQPSRVVQDVIDQVIEKRNEVLDNISFID